MAPPFLQQASPNGRPWEELCQEQGPVLDPYGFVTGPWGECIHYAVLFERKNDFGSMPEYQEDGPVGQVINFAGECGYNDFQDALGNNEEKTKGNLDSGNENFAFQPMQGQSQPQPTQYGQPAMVGFAPAAGAPQQMVMGELVQMDPYRLLGSLPKVVIEEKMNMLETASGLLGEMMGIDMELEMANKYVIRTVDGHNVFFAVEQTDFCNRQCGGDCRGIDIDVVVLGQDPKLAAAAEGQLDWSFNPLAKVDLSGSQKFIKLHKDCQFTCCCFNRPIIQVLDGNTGNVIGKIRDPWACCDMTFNLMDKDDQSTLNAKGGCCQLGLICPCPCGPCKEVKFGVTDAKSDQEVAQLKKIIPGCLKFIVADDVDNYEVEFGQVTDPQLKAMLVALGLFIDFRYFNVRSDKNDNAMDAGDDFCDDDCDDE